METPHASSGFLNTLKGLGDTLLGSVQDRLELISIELHEEKFRLIQILIWISAAVFAGVMSLTFVSITVVYLFWETARLGVLLGLTAFYTVALVVTLIGLRKTLTRQPRPFETTLRELREDRSCIQQEN